MFLLRTHPVARGIKIGSNAPPVWQSVPSPSFVLGVASNFPPSGTYQSNGYVTDADGGTPTVTWVSGSISGVTWDGGKFVYDGIGSVGTTGSLVLRADDGTDTVDSATFSIVIESNLAWSATPSVSFVESGVLPTNLGSYVTNYNASTDEFRVTPSYSLPLWLSLTAGPGTGSGNLTPNGTQVDADDVDVGTNPIKIDVRRSSGEWVSSTAFGVTVTPSVAAQGPFAIFAEQHQIAARNTFVVGNYGGWGAPCKHPFFGKVGDYWYRVGGDNPKHDPAHLAINASIDDTNDGRQEVYKWKATDDDSWRMDANYYRQAAETAVQAWNPDDGFAMTVGSEIITFRTHGVLTNLIDANAPPYATLVERPCAYNPVTKVWRDLGVNIETEIQGQNGSWHGMHYAAGNAILIPCADSKLIVKNATTFADITFGRGDLTVPGVASTARWWLTGGFIVGDLLYLYDATNRRLVSINLTQLLAWNSGGQPTGMVLNVGPIPEATIYAGGSWGGGLAYDSTQDIIAFFGTEIHVRARTGDPDVWQTFRRVDSFTVNNGGSEYDVVSQRSYYDADAGGFMCFASIDFETGKNDERFYVVKVNSQPAWIPALNEVQAISLNTPSSVTPGNGVWSGLGTQAGVFNGWNSGVFAPNFGPMGAYVVCGGGDADWWGNEVYVFPLAETTTSLGTYPALTWTRINNPSSAMDGTSAATDPQFNTTWYEHGDGTPAMPHTYDQLEYLPPHSGGGTYGSIVLCTKMVAYRTGHNATSHKCNLDTGVWSRASTGASSISLSVDAPSWCWHPRLRKMYGFPAGASGASISNFYYLDFVNRPASGVGLHGASACTPHTGLGYPCTRYWPSRDVLVQLGYVSGTTLGFKVYDPRTLTSGSTPTLVGDALPTSPAAFDVVNELDVFYVRSCASGDEQKIWKVTPHPTNWLTGNWTVQQITMTGDTVSGFTANGMWKRFSYAPQARSFVWCNSVTGAVYAYRPEGT